MVKSAFSSRTLATLVAELGFNKSGDPKAAARFLHELLGLAPLYKNQDQLPKLLPRPLLYAVLYAVTTHDVMEHGGGVGGSWLTKKGEELLAELNGIDWSLPYEPSALEFPTKKIVLRERDGYSDLDDEVSHRLDHCGCGCPEEAFDLTVELLELAPLTMDSEPLATLVANPGIRQFLIYHLTYLNMVEEGTGALTPDGIDVLSKINQIYRQEEAEEDQAGS